MRLRGRFLFLFLLVASLAPRVIGLDVFLTPDEGRWRENTLEFALGLRTGDLGRLYQQPHPGLTTMWLAWPTVEASSWRVRKLPLAGALGVLTALAGVLLVRLWGAWWGGAAGVLLALHPYVVAQSRILAMDALLAVFLLLAFLALLLWRVEGRLRWVLVSGACAALAVLSKLSGLAVVLFIGGYALVLLVRRAVAPRVLVRAALAWLGSFAVTACLVFPTLLIDPSVLLRLLRESFTTEHYLHPAHAFGPSWYLAALALFSTPLNVVALFGIPFVRWLNPLVRRQLGALAGLAALFFLLMEVSVKKGDRYLLPDFLLFDVLTVPLLAALFHSVSRLFAHTPLRRAIRAGVAAVVLVAVVWQVGTLLALHPYEHAYRNLLFRRFAVNRTMGWGEGLDLAAEYLNAQPGSENFLVASHYEGPFAYRFRGREVTPLQRLLTEPIEDIGADYVVLSRAMVGRAPDRWESQILRQFASRTPEKVIIINGDEYVWIYNVRPNRSPADVQRSNHH